MNRAATLLPRACSRPPRRRSRKDLVGVFEDALHNDPVIRQADANRLAAREARPQAWSAVLPQLNATAGSHARPQRRLPGPDQRSGEPEQPERPAAAGGAAGDGGIGYQHQAVGAEPAAEHFFVAELDGAQGGRPGGRAGGGDLPGRPAAADPARRPGLLQRAGGRGRAGSEPDLPRGHLAPARPGGQALRGRTHRHHRRAGSQGGTRHSGRGRRDRRQARTRPHGRSAAGDHRAEVRPRSRSPAPTCRSPNPAPADESRWVQVSLDQNLSLISSRLAAEIARDNVRIAIGGHLPSLDLVAGRSYQRQNADDVFAGFPFSDIDSKFNDRQIGLQLTVPIFSGGFTQSKVRETQYRWIAAKEGGRAELAGHRAPGTRCVSGRDQRHRARAGAAPGARVELDGAQGDRGGLRGRHAHRGRRAERAQDAGAGADRLCGQPLRLHRQRAAAAPGGRQSRPPAARRDQQLAHRHRAHLAGGGDAPRLWRRRFPPANRRARRYSRARAATAR